jgi:hypothetical protein
MERRNAPPSSGDVELEEQEDFPELDRLPMLQDPEQHRS